MQDVVGDGVEREAARGLIPYFDDLGEVSVDVSTVRRVLAHEEVPVFCQPPCSEAHGAAAARR